MQTIFGVSLAIPSSRPIAPELAAALAGRMAATAAVLKGGAPVAVAASARQDAQRYLAARRGGELRLPGFTVTRACDEAAHALMQLTLDAPPVLPTAERLVA